MTASQEPKPLPKRYTDEELDFIATHTDLGQQVKSETIWDLCAQAKEANALRKAPSPAPTAQGDLVQALQALQGPCMNITHAARNLLCCMPEGRYPLLDELALKLQAKIQAVETARLQSKAALAASQRVDEGKPKAKDDLETLKRATASLFRKVRAGDGEQRAAVPFSALEDLRLALAAIEGE